MPAPTLTTPRLCLRAHVLSDMDAFWSFNQSARAEYVGTPDTLTGQWYGLSSEVGSWDLMGHGGWGVTLQDGTLVGQVAITQPPHFPEREIGWILFEGHEGQGYAQEAAATALTWAWTQGWNTLVSYIEPRNARSIALARRLGAVLDADAPRPGGDGFEDTLVYRHTPGADDRAEACA